MFKKWKNCSAIRILDISAPYTVFTLHLRVLPSFKGHSFKGSWNTFAILLQRHTCFLLCFSLSNKCILKYLAAKQSWRCMEYVSRTKLKGLKNNALYGIHKTENYLKWSFHMKTKLQKWKQIFIICKQKKKIHLCSTIIFICNKILIFLESHK